MKIEGNKAYILAKNGEFLCIKIIGSSPIIGSEYTGNEIKKPLSRKLRHTAVAAILLFSFSLGGGVYAYNLPVSTITVSSIPEIQLKTNIFKRVIEISSKGENTEELIKDMNLKNKSIEEAVVKVANKVNSKDEVTVPLIIDINGKDLDTSNIKKNLDNKSINYKINNSNESKNDDQPPLKEKKNEKTNKTSTNKQNISNKSDNSTKNDVK